MHIHDIDRDHTFENLYQSLGTPMEPTSKKQIRGRPKGVFQQRWRRKVIKVIPTGKSTARQSEVEERCQ